jgi:four helix bundle protein
MSEHSFLPPHGNYAELLSYRKAEIVYDLTYRFCQRFLARGDRTIDQMIQAARSGKQNIVEGSKASVTSEEMEIKLTNVARASLEELLVERYCQELCTRFFQAATFWARIPSRKGTPRMTSGSNWEPLSNLHFLEADCISL